MSRRQWWTVYATRTITQGVTLRVAAETEHEAMTSVYDIDPWSVDYSDAEFNIERAVPDIDPDLFSEDADNSEEAQ